MEANWNRIETQYKTQVFIHSHTIVAIATDRLTENALVCDAAEGVCGGEGGEGGWKRVSLACHLRGWGRDQ